MTPRSMKPFVPPVRRFFYVCIAAALLTIGARAVNAEPTGADDRSKPIHVANGHNSHNGHSRDLIGIASRYIGSRNTTRQRGPWCGHFLNLVLRQAGYRTMPSGLARDAVKLGPRLSYPVPGALVITRRHVEIALGDGRSISGNWGGRVAIHPTHRGVVIQPSRG